MEINWAEIVIGILGGYLFALPQYFAQRKEAQEARADMQHLRDLIEELVRQNKATVTRTADGRIASIHINAQPAALKMEGLRATVRGVRRYDQADED